MTLISGIDETGTVAGVRCGLPPTEIRNFDGFDCRSKPALSFV